MDFHFHPTPRGCCIHIRHSRYPTVTIEAPTERQALQEADRLIPTLFAALATIPPNSTPAAPPRPGITP